MVPSGLRRVAHAVGRTRASGLGRAGRTPDASFQAVPGRIEDYALLGDTQTAALVSRDGSIDWLCLPRFDSDAVFAALLGGPEHGRWRIGPPADAVRAIRRRYRGDTLVLETDFETAEGSIRLVDAMPPREVVPDLVRVVEGVSGRVPVELELAARPGYGRTRPWGRRHGERTVSVGAGPDALLLDGDVPLRLDGGDVRASFTLEAGQRASFVIAWHEAHVPPPRPAARDAAVEDTAAWWRAWSERCAVRGPLRDQVVRSLVTLKALTYSPTGGVVAAPTTSLPERIGGPRNWDYRYCWVRDATFTLVALMDAGYVDEARAWRDWLLRAVAGDPSELQIVYGIGGERRLPEVELGWLPGYERSRPVRVGNAAVDQLQLDVYGEALDCLHQSRLRTGPEEEAWALQKALLEFLEGAWRDPDHGMWEVRGPRRHFTYSKVMAWVAFDRAVKAIEQSGRGGPLDRWRRLRAEIHGEVCARGYDAGRGAFTQSYGSGALDAALLLVPTVGFLPASDPRVRGTVRAIARDLVEDGLVLRYRSAEAMDGLPPGEGAFVACSFWLADALLLEGRVEEARALFDRLVALENDVGLLAEEYDPRARRQLGNFPQAFSHVALVNTALNLAAAGTAAGRHPRGEPGPRAG